MMLAPQIEAFVLCCVSAGIPISAMLYFAPTLRSRAFFLAPIGIALFLFVCAISAALMYSYIPFGLGKLIVAITIATAVTYIVLRIIAEGDKLLDMRIHNIQVLLLILGLAALAITDIFFILSQQGFQLDHTTYFRPPFHSDNERHLILINAIIRGDGSPFLPGAEHRYQILWHHFAALIVSVLSNTTMPTNYPLVSGVILFTSYVVFIALFWLVYLIRPELFQRYRWTIILFILVATHADVFNFSMSWFMNGYPGIEADNNTTPPLYRNFSPKLAALTAPQHTLFLIALTIYLGLRQFLKFPLSAASMADALIPIMVVISPILTILFLPFSMLIDGIQILRHNGWETAIRYAIKAVGLTILGAILFWVLLRFPPTDLLFRDGVDSLWPPKWTITKIASDILTIPAVLVAACGTLGMTLLVITLWLFLTKRFAALKNKYLLLALMMIYVANFVFQNEEIRRHTAILVFVVVLIALLQVLTLSVHLNQPRFQKYLLMITATTTILLHGYFVYSYTGKQSEIPSDIPWKDYLCMNKFIQERYPNTPTWASTNYTLRFPLVMEVVPSFSGALDIYVHSEVSPRVTQAFNRARHGIPPEAFMRELGYKLFIWGPVEKNTQVLPIPVELVNLDRRVARCGSVELFTLNRPELFRLPVE